MEIIMIVFVVLVWVILGLMVAGVLVFGIDLLNRKIDKMAFRAAVRQNRKKR